MVAQPKIKLTPAEYLAIERKAEFRSEFYNVLNHTNFGPPTVVTTSSAFGTITSTLPARQIQFALKLLF